MVFGSKLVQLKSQKKSNTWISVNPLNPHHLKGQMNHHASPSHQHHCHRSVLHRNLKMPGLSISKLMTCLRPSKLGGTRIHNLTDRRIELEIRVGSITKRVHSLKPGSSKSLNANTILKLAYSPSGCDELHYQEDHEAYVVIHDTGGEGLWRMVKQQHIGLEDLRDCSEIRVYRDHQRGCISVRKKLRPS